MKKRALAMLLAVVMVFSCLPLTVFAVAEDEEPAVTEEAPAVEAEAEAPAAEAEEAPAPEAEEAAPAEEAEPAPEAEETPSEEPFAEEEAPSTVMSTDSSGNILIAENFPDPGLLASLKDYFGGYLSAEDATLPFIIPVYGASNLTGLKENFPNLTELYLVDCSFTSLSLSGYNWLEYLDIYNNDGIASVTVSECPRLQALYVETNTGLTSVTVSNCYDLQRASFCNNLFSGKQSERGTVMVSGCTQLDWLDINGNAGFAGVTVTDCYYLQALSCFNNGLETLNVTECPSLTVLDCSNNRLTELDVTSLTQLNSLYCNNNGLYTLKVSGLTSLYELNCADNHLTSLDLSGCPLENYFCGEQTTDAGYLPAVILGGQYVIKKADCDLSGILGDSSDAEINGIWPLDDEETYWSTSESYINVYIPQDDWFGLDIRVDLDVISEPAFFGGDYYLLEAGSSWSGEQIPASGPGSYPDWVQIGAGYVSADGFDPDACVCFSLNPDGDLQLDALAAGTGTAFLIWYVPELVDASPVTTASFRLDICDAENPITGVSLSETKKTVELFKDEYASFEVILEMDRLLTYGNSQYLETETPISGSASLTSVKFVNADGEESALNDYFSLVCTDDRTVRIVPTEAAIQAALENKKAVSTSYTAPLQVSVKYDGKTSVYQTAPMTLTVKQTMPSLKAKAVTLNSYMTYSETTVSCTGGEFIPGGICEMVDAPLTEISAFIDETGSLKLAFQSPWIIKKSCTLKLECQLKGWRITAPLSLKVKLAPVEPKLTLSKTSVTLTAGLDDDIVLSYKPNSATEAAYPGLGIDGYCDFTDSKGNYYNGAIQLTTDYETRQLRINGKYADGLKPGAYTLTLYYGFGQTIKVKVKLLPFAQPKVSFSTSGALDLGTIAYTGKSTAIAIKPTVSGVNKVNGVYPGNFGFVVTQQEYDKNKALVNTAEVTDCFSLSRMDASGKLYLECVSSPESNDDSLPTRTYKYTLSLAYAYTEYSYSGSEGDTSYYDTFDLFAASPAKALTIKNSANLKPTAAVKLTGSIDPLHAYASAVSLTSTVKNVPYSAEMEQELVFYKQSGKEWIPLPSMLELTEEEIMEQFAAGTDFSPFWVETDYFDSLDETVASGIYRGNMTPTYRIAAISPDLLDLLGYELAGELDPDVLTQLASHWLNGTYGVSLKLYSYIGDDRTLICESPVSKLNVKPGKVKFATDKTAVTLLLKDRYDLSDAITGWSVNDGFSGISRLELDPTSAQWFRLEPVTGDSVAIGWKDNTLPVGWKSGTTKTVTVNVYVIGSRNTKPDATLKIKVSALSQPTATEK